jgi:FKBP-type peptidyl-prolyl cis-trans isomerase
MAEENELNSVVAMLTLWVTSVKLRNSVNDTGINHTSENLILRLLNTAYDYDLINLNWKDNNYPAIDLGDPKKGIAFQVTSTGKPGKISETLRKFYAQGGPHIHFPKGIYFFFLKEKTPNLNANTKQKMKSKFGFNSDQQMWSINTLLTRTKELYSKDRKRFDEVKELLEEEFGYYQGEIRKHSIKPITTPQIQSQQPLEEAYEQYKLPPIRALPRRHLMRYSSLGNIFSGRTEELWLLHEGFQRSLKATKNSVSGIPRIVILTGMGGIGKTQLAVEYVHRFGFQYPGGVFWVNAADEKRFIVNEIAKASSIEIDKKLEPQDQIIQLWRFLSGRNKVLIILDNFPLNGEIGAWLPSAKNIFLLVTSQRVDSVNYYKIKLKPLYKHKGLQLLNSTGPRHFRPAEAFPLIEMLGGLPLALELVKNFLMINPFFSIKQFMVKIKKIGEMKALKIFAEEYRDQLPTKHEKEITATFRILWDLTNKIEKQVLQVISLFVPASVPRSLIQKILGSRFDSPTIEFYDNPVDKAISTLASRLAMLDLDDEHNPSMHRLLAAFIKSTIHFKDSLCQDIVLTLMDEIEHDSNTFIEAIDVVSFSATIRELAFKKEEKIQKDELQKFLEKSSFLIRKILEKKILQMGEKNKIESEVFLAENKKREAVIVTESGLQYEVLLEGNGAHPEKTDIVITYYKGSMPNGEVFDSSYARGLPAKFPLMRVIAAWREGIPLMTVGSKYRFFCPPNLAYGERGQGSKIEPNAVLIFDVELLGINKKDSKIDGRQKQRPWCIKP